jgi:acyl-coenzyme A synthetase/AMP-(fatty) acid ligase
VAGATIRCIPAALFSSPEALVELYQKTGISWSFLPPAFFSPLSRYIVSHEAPEKIRDAFKSLRTMMLAGETLKPRDVCAWQSVMGTKTTLMNFYGPTETTVLASGHIIDYMMRPDADSVPIGSPFGGNEMVIVDENRRLCRTDQVGMIAIGGPQLSSGYFKNDALTEATFVELEGMPRDRVYMSGDMGKINKNGEIIFFGRLDNQVKVKGKRIELEEIENALMSLRGITQAAVIVRENAESKKIVSYFCGNGDVEVSSVKEALKNRLPLYMIPNIIKMLDSMPVNANGKIDKNRIKRMDDDTTVEKNEASECVLEGGGIGRFDQCLVNDSRESGDCR